MQPFSAYFSDWVKAYYKHSTIGKDGDFYTAVCASKFFGGAIANYIIKTLESDKLTLPLHIVDIGANSMNLLNDIRHFLDALSVGVVEHCDFVAIDCNSDINAHLDTLRLEHNAIFIANELFDALPCELYRESTMAFVEDSNIIFNPANDKINSIAEAFHITKGEIPLSYFSFVKTLQHINPQRKNWLFLVFDYGSESVMNDFSIRIYHKHKVFPLFSGVDCINLTNHFGKSDITYNVPFVVLDSAFSGIGARKILYKKQHLALVEDFGILDLLQQFYDDKSISNSLYLRESSKVKGLLNILSESFKTSIYSNF